MPTWACTEDSCTEQCCLACCALNLSGFADDVKEGFNVHFAETFEDVYKIALDYNAQDS